LRAAQTRDVNYGSNGFFLFVFWFVVSSTETKAQLAAMARIKDTGIRLWPAAGHLGRSRIYTQRRALQYLEDEREAKAACHLTAVASVQASELLCNPGILQEVCKYLIGHSLYVSLVCKAWKRCYELAAAESELTVVEEEVDDESDSDDEEEEKKVLQIGALHVTLYKAAFASAATVLYAYVNGLRLRDEAVTRSAGKYGSLEALAKVYRLDGNWDNALTHAVAARGMCVYIHACHIVTVNAVH
jgi:hypothetical protein